MTIKDSALKVISKNEEIIRERLLTDGYMYDDEFVDAYLTSPVARKLASCIEEYFNLEDEQYVIRQEMNVYERSDGVLYYSECKIDLPEIIEIAKLHYNI